MIAEFRVEDMAKEQVIDRHDTIIFDPPYESGLYKFIPFRKKKLQALVCWTSSRYVAEVFRVACARGWKYRFMVVWDGESSWYIPGNILLRDNLCIVFTQRKYNEDRALIIGESTYSGRKSKNCRGDYFSANSNSKKLQSVYRNRRSALVKVHKHQKPIDLMGAILGAIGCVSVVDLFCGSGGGAISATIAGAESYIGFDVDRGCIELATDFYKKNKDKVVTIDEEIKYKNGANAELSIQPNLFDD